MLVSYIDRHQSEKREPDHQIDREVLGPLGGAVEDIAANDLVQRKDRDQDQARYATNFAQSVDSRPKTPRARAKWRLFKRCLLSGLHRDQPFTRRIRMTKCDV